MAGALAMNQAISTAVRVPVTKQNTRSVRQVSRAASKRSSRAQLQIVASSDNNRSWQSAVVETAAPLMVALAVCTPASNAIAEEVAEAVVVPEEVVAVVETPEAVEVAAEAPEVVAVVEETPEVVAVVEETPAAVEETPAVVEETPAVVEEVVAIEETPEVVAVVEEAVEPATEFVVETSTPTGVITEAVVELIEDIVEAAAEILPTSEEILQNVTELSEEQTEGIVGREETTVRVNIDLPDDTVKLFYMTLGVAFVYGCCYFGATNDPFYDTEEYRADGGDGTQHWFYNVDSNNARAGREKIYQGLNKLPGEEEYDEFGDLAAKN